MFAALGRLTTRHPLIVIAVWLALTITSAALAIGGVGGQGIFDKLETSELRVPGSGSEKASLILDDSAGGSSVRLLVKGVNVTDTGVMSGLAKPMATCRTDLAAISGVSTVVDPWTIAPPDPRILPFIASDGNGFVIQVLLADGLSSDDERVASDAVMARLRTFGSDVTAAVPGASSIPSSSHLIGREINDVMESDLVRAEAVSLPISLVVMVLVFGGLLAAGMPIIGAIASIVGGFGAVLALSYAMKLDSVTVNVVTVIGLGLSIDYGLLMVSRFREELTAAGATLTGGPSRRDPLVRLAVRRTVSTAGRTVAFSALTIAASVLGLLAMSPTILRGIGVAAASVVVLALFSAITLLPAVLTVFGRRFARVSVLRRVPGFGTLLRLLGDSSKDEGAFSKLARWVQRRSWWIIAGVLILLAIAIVPLGGLQLRNSGIDLLPKGSDQRSYFNTLDASFPYLAAPDAYVVTETDPGTAGLATLSQKIAALDHVKSEDAPITLKNGHVLLQVRFDLADSGGKDAATVVKGIRGLDSSLMVAGEAAGQLDFTQALLDGLPLAASLVVAATFLMLFLMTGSLLVPLKALITNGISIAASVGISTWIFSTAHGFAVTGLESYIVAISIAFGFGLAMDYEVFLLGRVKELYDTAKTNDEAVRLGLQRSGRIITSAAAVIVVVFIGFGTGSLIPIQEIGVTLAIVVVLDATLVRMLLVPATMTVLGDLNWWAPGPLKRFAHRFAIDITPRHADASDLATTPPAPPRRAR
ncbi:MAG TPA: MMPL family transporter [Propionibacteriaceae bacterium]